MGNEEEYAEVKSYENVLMEEDDTPVDHDSGIEIRLMKCEDAGYTSSSNTSRSSSFLHHKENSEWMYLNEEVHPIYKEVPYSSYEDGFRNIQRKLLQQPSSVLSTKAFDIEEVDLGSDCEPLLKCQRSLSGEEDPMMMQLQRNVLNNTNQVRSITTKVKKTSSFCEKEIKELKTFLLWLDKRNSDAIKTTATTKTQLESRIVKIEKQMKESRTSGVMTEGVEKVLESEQTFTNIKQKDIVKDMVKENTENLSLLLSRFSDTSSPTTSPASCSSQQMEVMEKRLTKMFGGLLLLMVLLNLLMFWMNRDDR